MSVRLPLFPLGSVLYPGLVLPLHIFEERYRQLVADLQAGSKPRRFGVIAIRQGRETGVDGVSSLYETGCTAVVRQAERHADGTSDLITIGTDRFRLLNLIEPVPYFRGDVELLPDSVGDDVGAAAALVPAVHAAFRAYIDLLAQLGRAQITVSDLPDEPILLSYLVAATIVVDLPDKQRLLEAPDARQRLAAERTLLAGEMRMMRSLTATPAPELRYSPYSQN
jgi:uncharacterized protein